jgi:hypothetical protein
MPEPSPQCPKCSSAARVVCAVSKLWRPLQRRRWWLCDSYEQLWLDPRTGQ